MNMTKCLECLTDIEEYKAMSVFDYRPLCMHCYSKLYNEYINSTQGESQ